MMQHLAYLRYVLRHKWFVFLACMRLGAPIRRAIIHDLSKFRPSEWFPYANYFYGKPKILETYIWITPKDCTYYVDCLQRRYSDGSHEWTLTVKKKYGEPAEPSFDIYFKDTEEYRESLKRFNVAWNRHQKRNPHHWQYWVLSFDDGESAALEMPIDYVREMVADWIGAGQAIHGKVDISLWYERNKENMWLHIETRRIVEALIANYIRDYTQCDPLESSEVKSG